MAATKTTSAANRKKPTTNRRRKAKHQPLVAFRSPVVFRPIRELSDVATYAALLYYSVGTAFLGAVFLVILFCVLAA